MRTFYPQIPRISLVLFLTLSLLGVSLAQSKTVNVLCQVISGASPITAFNRMLLAIQVGTLTAQ